eukprot:90436-Alexandrium_andersonii.AAC.1
MACIFIMSKKSLPALQIAGGEDKVDGLLRYIWGRGGLAPRPGRQSGGGGGASVTRSIGAALHSTLGMAWISTHRQRFVSFILPH